MREQAQQTPGSALEDTPLPSLMPAQPAVFPDHVSRLPDSQWAVWNWVGLRSAGFPLASLLALTMPACATVADQLLEAEDERDHARAAVLDVLKRALSEANGERRARLSKAIRSVKRGKLPELLEDDRGTTPLEVLRAAHHRVGSLQAELDQRFVTETPRIAQVLHDIARTDRFREAVTWQNRRGLHTGIDSFLRKVPGANDSKNRGNQILVASYLQRYCAKNDTIGFFGPVGWASVNAHQQTTAVRPGPGLLAMRTVYFEVWCIDALAQSLSQNEALLPWIVPRRMPFLHLEDTTLALPLAPPINLSRQQAALLAACDGKRSAKILAAELLRAPASGFESEQEVYDGLKKLRDARRIAWAFEVPVDAARPEQSLRQQLERIDDDRLRRTAMTALDELEQARSRVGRAAGDAAQLNRALEALEATFVRWTGMEPTRHAGKMYAARTLVYEDCLRDIELTLGSDLIQRLGPPLALLLRSARWLSFTAATRYREAFKEIYGRLAQKTGAKDVAFADFWLWAQPVIFGEDARITDALKSLFQERWSHILALPTEARQVSYTVEQLGPQVDALFDAPGPGWRSARYHSPDIMIAASSAEALRQGDYQLVLGELHIGLNTLRSFSFVAQHPAPMELVRALRYDLPEPGVVPVYAKQWPAPPHRTLAFLISPQDFRLVFAPDSVRGVPRTGTANRSARRGAGRPGSRSANTRRSHARRDRRGAGRAVGAPGRRLFQAAPPAAS